MLWKRCNKLRTFRSVITNVFIMLVYTLSCSVNGGLVSVLVLSVQSRLALSHSLLNSEPVPEPPLTPGGGSGAINHLLIKEPYRTASHIPRYLVDHSWTHSNPDLWVWCHSGALREALAESLQTYSEHQMRTGLCWFQICFLIMFHTERY